jgi:tripartite-type tricarboxylate transporter receptor subunit TctC
MAGIDVLHVPYKGITPAMVDAVAGQVQFLISVIPAVLGTVKSGKLRALGVTSAKRTTLLPDLPAISETVPGYEFIGWYSIFAPAKTPAGIVNKLNAGIGGALSAPEYREKFTALGTEPRSSTPQELAAYLRAETVKMRKLVKESGAKPD